MGDVNVHGAPRTALTSRDSDEVEVKDFARYLIGQCFDENEGAHNSIPMYWWQMIARREYLICMVMWDQSVKVLLDHCQDVFCAATTAYVPRANTPPSLVRALQAFCKTAHLMLSVDHP